MTFHRTTKPYLRPVLSGAIALVAIVGAGWAAPAHAVACRDIQSVQQSANPDTNTTAGGHMTQHILGMLPPSGTSQAGKTLFADKGKAQAAWRQYQYIANPVACSSASAFQSVSLKDLGISNLDAYSCTAAGPNGACTTKTLYLAKSVAYGFIYNTTSKSWIVNTMYPEPLQ